MEKLLSLLFLLDLHFGLLELVRVVAQIEQFSRDLSAYIMYLSGLISAMNPFTRLVASKLPNQYHKHALEVDSHLRVLGAPLGTVYCIGDAATIETNLVNHLWELVEYCDVNRE